MFQSAPSLLLRIKYSIRQVKVGFYVIGINPDDLFVSL